MTSLQYYCILGLADIKNASQRQNKCTKDAGWVGNKITADHRLQSPKIGSNVKIMIFFFHFLNVIIRKDPKKEKYLQGGSGWMYRLVIVLVLIGELYLNKYM